MLVWTPTIAPSDIVYYEDPLFPEFHQKMLMTVLKDKKLIAIEVNTAGTLVLNLVVSDKNNVLTCSSKLLHTTSQCDDTIGIGIPTGLLRAKSPCNDVK